MSIQEQILQVRPIKLKQIITYLESKGVRSKHGTHGSIKFYFKSHVWTLHPTGKEIKHGAIRELRKIVIAESFFS